MILFRSESCLNTNSNYTFHVAINKSVTCQRKILKALLDKSHRKGQEYPGDQEIFVSTAGALVVITV